MEITTIIAAAVITYVGYTLIKEVRDSIKQPTFIKLIFKGLRVRHFGIGLGILAVVIPTVVSLIMLHDVFAWGWWSMMGGNGNIIFGQHESTTGGDGFPWITTVLLALIIVAMPKLVHAEEEIFRSKSIARSHLGRIGMALFFGFIHIIMGVPIAALIALSLAGYILTFIHIRAFRKAASEYAATLTDLTPDDDGIYRASIDRVTTKVLDEQATLETTRIHLAYNYTIVAVVILATYIL